MNTPQTSTAQPAPILMTESQLIGMMKFAARCEKAYRATNQTQNAEQAKAHREWLEAEYVERFGGAL
jgi:hypothetical protein